MMITRKVLAALTVALVSVFSSVALNAEILKFGVVGSPIDLSANVKESILPGSAVFQDSKPLFGTTPDTVQSAELLHVSDRASTARGVRPTFPVHSRPLSPSRTAMVA